MIEPATQERLAELPCDDPADLDDRIALARRAQREWSRTSLDQRAAILWEIGAAVDRAHDELAELESRNVGKPLRESRGEIALVARTFRYYAGAVDKHFGQTVPTAGEALHYTLRQPIGVVAAIVPWNFPMVLASWKVAPALACGNAVLVKPAALTPMTTLRLAEICAETGVPDGCMQVLVGSGATVGRAILDHPEIRKISFTGSTEVGREVMERGAKHVKRLTLELGGKSANLVFADADLEVAVEQAIDSAFANAGQDCCARARILVESPIYDEFVGALRRRIEAIVVGDPLDAATEIGSLISAGQRDSVSAHIEGAIADGATLLCGAERPPGRGYFLAPALLVDVSPQMRVMRGDLRSGRRRLSVRGRARGGLGRQRQRLRPLEFDLDRRCGARVADRRSTRNGGRLDQLQRLGPHHSPVRGHEGVGPRSGARDRGP